MTSLDGRTVFITGASTGVGKAIAYEIAKVGKANLILAARRIALIEELKTELESKYEGVKVLPLKLDVSKVEEIESTIASLPEEFANIDVLINNAGLALGVDYVRNLDMQDTMKVINTNVIGLIAMTKAIIRIFYKNDGHGDIVNISSIAGQDSYPGGSIYCCSKAAADRVSRGLEPLSGQDIGELIVFGITRRENFVLSQATALPSFQADCTYMYRKEN